jgi:ribonucleotide reductase-like protein
MEELETLFQQYIATSKYSRWLDEEGRREIWPEPPRRYVENVVRPVLTKAGLKKKEIEEVCEKAFDYIRNTLVLPSMRAMMTAGPALDRDHMAGYNCSYLAIEHPRAFDEALYILSCGTGLGFSVERQFISQLPDVAEEFHDTDTVIKVRDSKVGWATALKETITLLYNGQVPKFDVSAVRPAGARLKVFGGRASGPQPLVDLLNYCVRVFKGAAGRKLNSLEAHGIMCKIGEAIVVGGVRRCLKIGTMVNTSTGPKRIEQVAVGDTIQTDNGFKRVLAKEATGEKPIYEIHTRCGVVESTADHRHAVIRSVEPFGVEWIETKAITPDDTMVFFSLSNIESRNGGKELTPFNNVELHFNAKPYTRPTHMNEDLAWFLGALCDGSCIERGVVFTQRESNVEFLHKAQRIAVEQFDVSADLVPGHGTLDLKLWRRQLSRDLKRYKSKRQGQLIHSDILSASRQEKLAFLAGVLDADGTMLVTDVERGKGTVQFRIACSIDKNWIVDVSRLLGSMGIPSRVRVQGRGGDPKRQPMWRVELADKHFADSLAEELYPYSIKAQKDYQPVGPRKQAAHALVVTRSGHNTPRVMGPMDFRSFNWPDGALPAKVESIVLQDADETFDLQIEEDECFIANGHLTHNSALISLSNLTDQRMRNAKSGQWWESHPEYSLANNSVAYTEKPDTDAFMQEWLALYQSKAGERGIFNRDGARRKMKRLGRRDPDHEWGGNPCLEILLRSLQTCNLTEVVVRPEDTIETLLEKVELATILGTIQSTFTTFRYLRPGWKRNIEEERLLGVSFTGIYDNKLTSGWGEEWHELDANQQCLKAKAIETNKIWAEKLGINPSTSVTCVKPAGTTSSLSNTASGIHPRHAPFYLRAVRQDNKDALTRLMKDQGIPNEPCVSRPESTTIFYFPMKAPEGTTTKDDLTALNHLELWKKYNTNWAEHTVSVTVSVREHEWMEVGAWVYKHFDDITGISFLPFDQGTYKQAPFQSITREEYEAAVAKMPQSIDWSQLTKYEIEDETTGSRELACVGNVCEIA